MGLVSFALLCRYKEAVDDFEKALEIDPAHANARKYLVSLRVDAIGRQAESCIGRIALCVLLVDWAKRERTKALGVCVLQAAIREKMAQKGIAPDPPRANSGGAAAAAALAAPGGGAAAQGRERHGAQHAERRQSFPPERGPAQGLSSGGAAAAGPQPHLRQPALRGGGDPSASAAAAIAAPAKRVRDDEFDSLIADAMRSIEKKKRKREQKDKGKEGKKEKKKGKKHKKVHSHPLPTCRGSCTATHGGMTTQTTSLSSECVSLRCSHPPHMFTERKMYDRIRAQKSKRKSKSKSKKRKKSEAPSEGAGDGAAGGAGKRKKEDDSSGSSSGSSGEESDSSSSGG